MFPDSEVVFVKQEDVNGRSASFDHNGAHMNVELTKVMSLNNSAGFARYRSVGTSLVVFTIE